MTILALACRPCVAAVSLEPHPAVARIIVPERSATSYGTGTLIDVREQYGLVITNWHVVRDGTAPPEVVFPNGFRSKGRPLKLDSHWDLAALVIWRPPIEPVRISQEPPRPGDWLTICGYGPGDYRASSGRCTQYYAPRVDYPQELVELNVEARQGDSGGPIFNTRGELAGVLFGAGRGTTMGSYGGRVHEFLASLAPDIGRPTPLVQLAGIEHVPVEQLQGPHATAGPHGDMFADSRPVEPAAATISRLVPIEPAPPAGHVVQRQHQESAPTTESRPAPAERLANHPAWHGAASGISSQVTALQAPTSTEVLSWRDVLGRTPFQQLSTLLVIAGAFAIILQLAKRAG